MLSYLVVFVGAGIGGAARHGMNIWVARLMGTHFPWHTLAINILGSIVMGIITGWFAERLGAAGHLRLFLATGIMGGFTTFSAFSLEVALMIERRAWVSAFTYSTLSVVASVAALFAGMMLVRKLLAA